MEANTADVASTADVAITADVVSTEYLTSHDIENSESQGSNIFTPKLASIVYASIGTVGVVGNLLTVVVMCSSAKLRSKITNMYIINQSLLDLVVSVLIIAISNLNYYIPYRGLTAQWYCLGWQSRAFVWGLMASSTYNLVALTLERYLEVAHPIWHKLHFTKNKALVSMVILWLAGPLWEGAGKISSTQIVDGKCSLYSNWPNEIARRAYGINVVIFKLIVPLVILVYAYGRIAWILHSKIKAANDKKTNTDQAPGRKTLQSIYFCKYQSVITQKIDIFTYFRWKATERNEKYYQNFDNCCCCFCSVLGLEPDLFSHVQCWLPC